MRNSPLSCLFTFWRNLWRALELGEARVCKNPLQEKLVSVVKDSTLVGKEGK